MDFLSLTIILILFLGFGYPGSSMARNQDRSFLAWFCYRYFRKYFRSSSHRVYGKFYQNRSFNPQSRAKSDFKVSAIKQLNELNEKGKLSDEEFERIEK